MRRIIPESETEDYRYSSACYFASNKELILHVDSTKDGPGAALLQDGKPIENVSRALASTKRNLAQIHLTPKWWKTHYSFVSMLIGPCCLVLS